MSDSLYYGIERQLSHNPIVSHVSLTCLTENSRIHLQLLKVDGSEIRSMGEKIYFYYEENVFVEEGLQTIEVYNSGSPDRPEEGFYQNNFAIKKLSKNKSLGNENYEATSGFSSGLSKNREKSDKLKRVIIKQIDDIEFRNQMKKIK